MGLDIPLMAALQERIVTSDFWLLPGATVCAELTRWPRPLACVLIAGIEMFLIKPGGFPGLAGTRLNALIDSTAGRRGGGFTGC